MMRLVFIFVIALALFAQSTGRTAATVTSSSSFKLGGVDVPVVGVPAWPVAVGDEIQAGDASTLISFSDGSRVTLDKRAKAKIERDRGKTLLRLVEGSCSYALASRLSLRLFVADKPAEIRGLQGSLSTPSAAKAAIGRPVAAEAVRPPPPPPLSRY